MSNAASPIALLPAAGAATRLDGAMKELLPVVFRRSEGGLLPVPALVHALETVAAAGLTRAVVVVSPGKLDLVRVLTDGAELGLELAWVVQPEPSGLTDAIVRGLRWSAGARTVLMLPDTVFRPTDALSTVANDTADISLAVFPADRPEELGPVEHDAGRVLSVLDKPTGPCPPNTWGLIGMSAAFQRWLIDRCASDPESGRVPVGLHINAAMAAGLIARAHPFEGLFADLGTPKGLADWVLD